MTDGKCIEMVTVGNTSVLQANSFTLSAPDRHEVKVKQTFVGVNFVDIYFRKGIYPIASLPAVLGVEAVGIIEDMGADVVGFYKGQRVAYAGHPLGSYASHRNVSADRLILVPDEVPDEVAAASLLRGLTAFMLMKKIRAVKSGDVIFMHAAAGGLGQTIGQWGNYLGARLIGTVSSEAKKIKAQESGYDDLILYQQQDVVDELKRLTQGKGADYVIDGIGSTLGQSISCAASFGTVANVGQAGGIPPVINIKDIPNSVSYVRPSILQYISDIECYHRAGKEVMRLLAQGILKVEIDQILPLDKVAEAHHRLETGRSTGVLLLRV